MQKKHSNKLRQFNQQISAKQSQNIDRTNGSTLIRSTRTTELDFLKCIFIILMVMFHLSSFGDKHTLIKQFVYTFHMPAFLILSGYLTNINKGAKLFFHGVLWIFIPYTFMEIGYTLMAALLPIREHIDGLNIFTLLDNVLRNPIGPYWYLHTLIICEVSYYVIFRLKKINTFSKFILLGVFLYLLSRHGIEMIVFANALYFLIGAVIRQSNISFLTIFQASLWAIVPLVILSSDPQNLNRSTLSGVAITYFIISLLLALYHYIPKQIKSLTHYVGRNTLVILLFSPVFTILAKPLIPLFTFDPTGICFACIATAFAVTGCFVIAYVMDYAKLSRFFFGQEKSLK